MMGNFANFDEQYPPDKNPVGAPTPPAVDAAPAAPATPTIDSGEDMLRGLGGGLERGAVGLAGLPGTVVGLADKASDYLAGKLGVSPEEIAAYRAKVNASPLNVIPTPQSIQSAVEPYTGQFYVPQTVPGQYASTLGEFAAAAPLGGGSLGARALNTVTGALGSETAGQFTKGTGAEPWARFLGGFGGSIIGAKGLTPTAPATAQRAADVATLEGAGVPLTAGERTGSKLLQTAESSAADMPFSAGAAQDAAKAQAAAVNKYFTEQAFDPNKLAAAGVKPGEALPSQNVMQKGVQTLSDEYNRIINPNQLDSALPLPAGGTVGSKLQNDLLAHEIGYYNQGLPTGKSPALTNARNDIIDALVLGQGKVSGAKYQAMRSDLGDIARNAYTGQNPDTALGAGAKGMKASLDEAFNASLPADDAAALAANNQRYANMKQLTPAVNAGGENLVPSQVAAAVRSGRAVPYSQGAGSMDEVARAAANVLRPLPNSMTAARTGWQSLFNAAPWLLTAGSAGAGAAGGFGPLGILGAAAIPHVVGRAVVSAPVQAYLGNTVLPQAGRDVITQAMLQQGISQPAGIDRNQAAQAAYNAQRNQRLRDIGLAPRVPLSGSAAPYDFAPVR